MKFRLGEDELNVDIVNAFAGSDQQEVEISATVRQRVSKYRSIIDRYAKTEKTFYGINTGFGLLADVKIPREKIEQLQTNLIRSHAIGVGPLLEDALVRALMLVKAHGISFGPSGVRPEILDLMNGMLSAGVLPCIPAKGSVGASGDLAPLAHLALGMIGEGFCSYRSRRMPAAEALMAVGLKPITLLAKEGLSLINGTQFMSALGAVACSRAKIVSRSADVAAALSLDAFNGTTAAFDERIHAVRRQHGQALVAANLRQIFAVKDEIMESHADCGKVQDPYSFRCVPQVHGASRDAISYVETILNRELNAVTDNPLVFDDESIFSGGNFHGQPVALALDFLAIAVAELGSISERRIEKLTNPAMSDLPPFLVKDSGLNSGYMIPHVTAAALVSENKVLAHPSSVDSIPTSADKEDHVSMGPFGARKALEIIDNTATIIAIELAAAAQGIELLLPLKPNKYLDAVFGQVRQRVPFIEQDTYIADGIGELKHWVLNGGVLKTVESVGMQIQ
jgi:histidine ammonia-lyase